MFACRRNIVYSAPLGPQGVGDLFLPQGGTTGSPVVLIHGGGWNALSKESFEYMVPLFTQSGRAVFNINYRLLDEAPWPACGDDCLAAARFVLEGGLKELPVPQNILVCGGSAGGHLAMMTALRLPRRHVESVVSLAGPSRLDWVAENRDPLGMHEGFLERFFGHSVPPEGAEAIAASPALRGEKNAPPLFCFQSLNDRLIPPRHSREAVAAWCEGGSRAELVEINGDGELHGFWINDEREQLRPELADFISHVIAQLNTSL